MWPSLQFPVDLVTFTEEILNGQLHFLCSGSYKLEILYLIPKILQRIKLNKPEIVKDFKVSM